jgi:predicted lipoprotein with Yx(FWY)xxD motif
VQLRAVRNTALDAVILISPRGLTLYHYTADKGKKIACTGQCAVFWPPLLIKRGAKPTAARGLDKKKLGTIRRPNGRYQVTYAGLTLYTFAADKRRGDVKGQGVEKSWYAVGPNGRLVKRTIAAG